MSEPTLDTAHIERCARALEVGYNTVDAKRAAQIMRALAADRDRWANNSRVLLANLDWMADCTGEGPEDEDAALVAAIRAEIDEAQSPTRQP